MTTSQENGVLAFLGMLLVLAIGIALFSLGTLVPDSLLPCESTCLPYQTRACSRCMAVCATEGGSVAKEIKYDVPRK